MTSPLRLGGGWGVKIANSLGKYIGMSSHFERNKSKEFRKLKEKVWKILQGSKSEVFLLWRKEILINVVAQTILNYGMSCFRLSINIYNDLTCYYVQF